MGKGNAMQCNEPWNLINNNHSFHLDTLVYFYLFSANAGYPTGCTCYKENYIPKEANFVSSFIKAIQDLT